MAESENMADSAARRRGRAPEGAQTHRGGGDPHGRSGGGPPAAGRAGPGPAPPGRAKVVFIVPPLFEIDLHGRDLRPSSITRRSISS